MNWFRRRFCDAPDRVVPAPERRPAEHISNAFIFDLVQTLIERMTEVMTTLAELLNLERLEAAEIGKLVGIVQGVRTELAQAKADLAAAIANNDPVAMQAVADQIQQNINALQTAENPAPDASASTAEPAPAGTQGDAQQAATTDTTQA